MAQWRVGFSMAMLLLLVSVAVATPPGIAKNPSHATCKIKKYKLCYNLPHVCPKFCPDQCYVECASCKPICGVSPPDSDDSPSPNPPETHSPPLTPTSTPPAPLSPPTQPPPMTPSPPPQPPSSTPPPSPPTPESAPVSTPPPSPPTPESAPVSTPPPTPSNSPTPSTPSETPSPPTPSTPNETPSPPTKSPPPSNSSESSGQRRARCKNRNYPQCYNAEHICPSSCPDSCEVDCVSCKPVCKCDQPGAICQDPRFIGGDGITFYFHGKKDSDFCLLSDSNLHINGHFIGRRNQNMKRDFTWVQSIGVLFNKHQLFIGALKTTNWDDSVDRLAISFDGKPVNLPASEDTSWKSSSVPSVSISRTIDANSVIVEVDRMFRIMAKVVPITEQDSIVHNYGITNDDCFAHLDLGFKFFSLSNEVSGVLGQTYRPDYVSRVKIGAAMPVMGGDKEFRSSSMFSTDCAVARFDANEDSDMEITEGAIARLELPTLTCASRIDGIGVVCKR